MFFSYSLAGYADVYGKEDANGGREVNSRDTRDYTPFFQQHTNGVSAVTSLLESPSRFETPKVTNLGGPD